MASSRTRENGQSMEQRANTLKNVRWHQCAVRVSFIRPHFVEVYWICYGVLCLFKCLFNFLVTNKYHKINFCCFDLNLLDVYRSASALCDFAWCENNSRIPVNKFICCFRWYSSICVPFEPRFLSPLLHFRADASFNSMYFGFCCGRFFLFSFDFFISLVWTGKKCTDWNIFAFLGCKLFKLRTQ